MQNDHNAYMSRVSENVLQCSQVTEERREERRHKRMFVVLLQEIISYLLESVYVRTLFNDWQHVFIESGLCR